MKKKIFILAGIFVLIAAVFVFYNESPRMIEKAKTKSDIMSFFRDRDVDNPKVSIKGDKVVVEWISANNQANVQNDLNCIEKIRIRVRENEFINKVQVYIYASKYDMMNGEPKGQMTDNHLSLNIPPEVRDWFAENYGPPTRTQLTESENEKETSPRPAEPELIEPIPNESNENYGVADIRTRVPELGESQYSDQDIADMIESGHILRQEILRHPGDVYILGEGYANPLEVLLDVNLDGMPDRISLSVQGGTEQTYRYGEVDGVPHVGWELYTLKVNDSTYKIGSLGAKECEPLRWNILAFSPDGNDIVFGVCGITQIVPFKETILFSYDGNSITNVFWNTIDLLAETTTIVMDSIIAERCAHIPFSSRVVFEWKRNSEGKYEPCYEEMYDFLDEDSGMLNISIKLYAQPDLESEVVGIIGPEKVFFKKSDFGLERDRKPSGLILGTAQSWVYIETSDGISGWTQIGTFNENVDGEWIDVFEAYSFREEETNQR